MEAEIQGQKLTEVITKLKGDLKTVAERNARLLRKMTEMQLLMTDASRKGLVSPQVLKEALELLKPGGKSKFIQAVRVALFFRSPSLLADAWMIGVVYARRRN